MKHLKMLGLVAVVAMGLVALVGTGAASATVLCKTNTNPCTSKWSKGTELDFSLKNETSAIWRDTFGYFLKTCGNGRLRGKITAEGSETEEVSIELLEVSWSNCSAPTVSVKLGELEISNISGTDNGTVYVKNSEFTTEDELFGDCTYGTGTKTMLGVFTASSTGDALMDINSVLVPIGQGCCFEVKWLETFTLTSPQETPLYVKPS